MADPTELPGPAGPAAVVPDVQPVPPTAMNAGASHNSGIALEWTPDVPATIAAASVAESQVVALVGAYQAQAAQFIAEMGAQVVAGHSPVGLQAANQPGPADIGGPGNSGQTDG